MKRRFSLTAQLTGMIELLMVGFSAVVLALFLMSARSLLLRHFESSLQRDAYVIAKELALSLDRSQEETLYARMSGSGASTLVLSISSRPISARVTAAASIASMVSGPIWSSEEA